MELGFESSIVDSLVCFLETKSPYTSMAVLEHIILKLTEAHLSHSQVLGLKACATRPMASIHGGLALN